MKDNMINVVLQRMSEGYEEQLPYYEKVLGLAEEQKKILNQEEINMEDLLDCIGQRQELIHILDGLNKEVNRLKQEVCGALGLSEFTITNLRQSFQGTGLDELDNTLNLLAGQLKRIEELDKNNLSTLSNAVDKTKEKLKQLQYSKKAASAYSKNPPVKDGVFIDYSK